MIDWFIWLYNCPYAWAGMVLYGLYLWLKPVDEIDIIFANEKEMHEYSRINDRKD